MRYYDAFPEYVPVAQRRAKAERKLNQLRKKNPNMRPVRIDGRTLATTWWGKSWNNNLERYADYSNRIGRGRSYVRHGSVLDLQLHSGNVTALVQGSQSRPYEIAVKVDKLNAGNWQTIRHACEGSLDSLSELLAGKFPQALKDLFFAEGAGLFPTPQEIHFDCSCPDWASMCKHVAATLYGVGARLDEDPALFFTLRGIQIDDIIAQTVAETAQALLSKAERQSDNILEDIDLGDVFGIQLDNVDTPVPDLPPVHATTSKTQQKVGKAHKTVAIQHKAPPRASQQRTQSATAIAPNLLNQGTMLDAVVKAAGRARKGKSVEQMQDKLGWTKIQVRNAISRAGTKGLVETVTPGFYRQKV